MSGQPRRPVFHEGQVLRGVDLDRTVEYPREALARHERSLHTWGITEGLEPAEEERTDAAGNTFLQITIGSGSLIDGAGRQVVVPEPVVLDEDDFRVLNGTTATDPDTWFPVFLVAREDPAPPEGVTPSACGGRAQPTRRVEGFEIEFGRAGDELGLDDQTPPAPDAGPGDGVGPWRVLLCFVRWDNDHFSELATAANGIGRRYAGVRADEVAARGGRVEVRTRAVPARSTPAMVVDEQDGGRMLFGLHDGAGSVTPMVRFLANGDVRAEGTVFGAFTSGSVYVESGSATDGVVLPLPAGISQEQVDDGSVSLHVSLALHVPPSAEPPGVVNAVWIFTPVQLEVDAQRRVRCVVRWFDVAAGSGSTDAAGTCDYTVIAAASATDGAP